MPEVDRRFFDALMADKKLSLRGLAQKMSMNHSQLSLAFSGARRLTLEEASQLSQIFGVPIHRIVEAAGVMVKPHTGKRAKVIGAMSGNGTVTLHEEGVIERTSMPADMPADTVAVQCRTAGSELFWMDGWVLFCREPNGINPVALGRFCLGKAKDGPVFVATLRRGYRDGSFNARGPFNQDSLELEWASPVEITRN